MSNFIISAFADEIDMDLKKQMDTLDEHGIKYIEMRGVNGKGLVEYSASEAKEIKKQLDDRGFKLSAVGSPLGKIKITDDFSAHLDLFRHTLEIAHVMEVKYIRMFSFFMPGKEDPGIYRDEVLERWSLFVHEAKGCNVILSHENEKGIYGDTAKRCLDILETLDCDYVKAVFDPANFVQCGEETYPRAFNMLKNHIGYVHIKDALYSDGQVVLAGYGDGKIPEILKELNDMGFKAFLSLEPHLGSFEGMAGLEQELDVSQMEKGGPGKFSIAANALKDVLSGL